MPSPTAPFPCSCSHFLSLKIILKTLQTRYHSSRLSAFGLSHLNQQTANREDRAADVSSSTFLRSYHRRGFPSLPPLQFHHHSTFFFFFFFFHKEKSSHLVYSRPQKMSLGDSPVLWERSDFLLSSSRADFSLPLGISNCCLNFKYNNQVYTRGKLCLVPLATALTFTACSELLLKELVDFMKITPPWSWREEILTFQKDGNLKLSHKAEGNPWSP